MNKHQNWLRTLTLSGVIAGLYLAVSLLLAPISFSSVQFRVAEAFTLIPALSPAGVIGVSLGCFLANLLNPGNLGPVDIVGGTLATLLAGLWTRRLGRQLLQTDGASRHPWQKKRLLLPLPTILCNMLIVGSYLPFLLLEQVGPGAVALSVVTVGLGEAGVLYLIGLPLLDALQKSRIFERQT
ncbi:MAG: QueT transporter family protein [Oscillospiraceae bacterium]|nr:QueT transporter family protein [Oscillospiraceae bacterium]